MNVMAFTLTNDYAIILPENPTAAEVTAAEELQDYLRKTAGLELDIASCNTRGKCNIHLSLPDGVASESLLPDGIIIRTDDEGNIYLAGEGSRGTLYAVYTFLEKIAGIRWLSPDAEVVPQHSALEIPAMDFRYAPPFAVRTPVSPVFFNNPAHAARRRVNGTGVNDKFGGSENAKWLSANTHTMFRLLPDQSFYNTHKDWFTGDFIIPGDRHELFSFRDGRRISGMEGQACLTNPEVRKIVIHNAVSLLKWKMPAAEYISITQNDNQNFCMCPECTAKADELGSQTDLWLWFLNDVAEALAEEFPGIQVETFAYQYTLAPPLTVIPRDNIRIRICLIEADSRLPFFEGSNSRFAAIISGWDQVSDNLAIWHYITNFTRFGLIHPNFRSYGPNMRFFADCGINNIYSQDSTDAGSFGFFPELRSYLISSLLWDPDADREKLIDEFMNGFYGSAAPFMKEYLRLYEDALAAAEGHILDCYEMDTARWLPEELLEKGSQLLRQAEAAAAGDPAAAVRVSWIRISHNWTVIARVGNTPLRTLVNSTGTKDLAALREKTFAELAAIPKTKGYKDFYVQEGVNLANGISAMARRTAEPFPVEDIPVELQDVPVERLTVLEPSFYTPVNAEPAADFLAHNKESYRMHMGNHNWALRVDLSACNSEPADIYAELRLPQDVTAPAGTAAITGFYTYGTNFTVKTAVEIDSAWLNNQGYTLVHIGKNDFTRDRQIYFEGTANTTVPELLLGRIWLVKE